jgi:hypothetical protein
MLLRSQVTKPDREVAMSELDDFLTRISPVSWRPNKR